MFSLSTCTIPAKQFISHDLRNIAENEGVKSTPFQIYQLASYEYEHKNDRHSHDPDPVYAFTILINTVESTYRKHPLEEND